MSARINATLGRARARRSSSTKEGAETEHRRRDKRQAR